MARYEEVEGLPIGEVLKRARSRQQFDISTIEQRTKIRTKYLRAMEQDEWEVLPNHAYAKGFLRTYAQVLGLDADALVDEYRRQYEVPGNEGPYTFTEPVLEGRRRLAGTPPRWPGTGTLVVLGILALVGILIVLGLTGGDDGGHGKRQKHAQGAHNRRHHAHRANRQPHANQPPKVALRFEANAPIQVCLVADSQKPVIDDEVLNPGTVAGTFNAEAFDLRFPSGYDLGMFDLLLNGQRAKLPETQGPTEFRVTPPAHVQQVSPAGTSCP